MHTNTTEENGTGFSALGLAPELLKAVADAGYTPVSYTHLTLPTN